MPKHKSISQRLKTAGTLELKLKIAHDWSLNWQREQSQLVADLGQAIKANKFDDLCIIAGELKAVTEKRFTALPKVLAAISGADNESVKP